MIRFRPDSPRNIRIVFLIAALLWCVPRLLADTISGVVKDPSGAVVVGARIEIAGNNLAQPINLASDDSGRFSAPNLGAGQYSVRVTKDGFEQSVTTVELHGTAELAIKLTLQEQQISINVTDKSPAFANADQTYRA